MSFGITSGVITALGMIVGLDSATSSRLAVIAGIIVMAVADGFADAAGQHSAEEAEMEQGRLKHTKKEVWMATLSTFISVTGSILSFAIPLVLFPLKTAIAIDIVWGLLLLILLNLYTAKANKQSALKRTAEHILLAFVVIIVSYYLGGFIAIWLK